MKQLIAFVGLCLVLYGCAGFGAFLDESDGKTAGSVTAGGTTTGGTTTGGTTTGGTTTGGTTTGGTTTGGTTTGGTSGGTTYMETTLYQEDYERFKDSKDLIGYAWTGDSSEDDKISPIQLGKRSDGIPVEFGQQCSILYSLPNGGPRRFNAAAPFDYAEMSGLEFSFKFPDPPEVAGIVYVTPDIGNIERAVAINVGNVAGSVTAWHRVKIFVDWTKEFVDVLDVHYMPYVAYVDGVKFREGNYIYRKYLSSKLNPNIEVSSYTRGVQGNVLVDDLRIFKGMIVK